MNLEQPRPTKPMSRAHTTPESVQVLWQDSGSRAPHVAMSARSPSSTQNPGLGIRSAIELLGGLAVGVVGLVGFFYGLFGPLFHTSQFTSRLLVFLVLQTSILSLAAIGDALHPRKGAAVTLRVSAVLLASAAGPLAFEGGLVFWPAVLMCLVPVIASRRPNWSFSGTWLSLHGIAKSAAQALGR